MISYFYPQVYCLSFPQRWNDTYHHFHMVDPKQTYYLSMEYLQGRALTNAIGNLDLRYAYSDSLNKLGHELEAISEQVCHPFFLSFFHEMSTIIILDSKITRRLIQTFKLSFKGSLQVLLMNFIQSFFLS